jgi:hypothetical protein
VLDKIFQLLYNVVLVSITKDSQHYYVYVEIHKNKKIINSDEQIFGTDKKSKDRFLEYIKNFTKETPYFYISYLDDFKEQGAIPTCDEKELENFININDIKKICYNNLWGVYTSKIALKELKKNLEEIGVDFVFSPIFLLYNFYKDKVTLDIALYVLIKDNSITLAVFKASKLLYGDYIDITFSENLLEMDDEIMELDDEENNEEDIDLEEISLDDDVDELDDFGDIEDLDTLEDIDDFSHSKDLEEELEESYEDVVEDNISQNHIKDDDTQKSLSDDYKRFKAIMESINEFYKNDIYESEFIENIYVADSIGLSGEFKKYLQEEMFMSVYIRHIDIPLELIELTKMELGL